jgi:hypothetical protein
VYLTNVLAADTYRSEKAIKAAPSKDALSIVSASHNRLSENEARVLGLDAEDGSHDHHRDVPNCGCCYEAAYVA